MTKEMYDKCLNPDMIIWVKLPEDVRAAMGDKPLQVLREGMYWQEKFYEELHNTGVYRINPGTPYEKPLHVVVEKSTQQLNVLSNGVVLKAVPCPNCNGCYWRNYEGHLCGSPNRDPVKDEVDACGRKHRADGHTVIWVEVKPEPPKPHVPRRYNTRDGSIYLSRAATEKDSCKDCCFAPNGKWCILDEQDDDGAMLCRDCGPEDFIWEKVDPPRKVEDTPGLAKPKAKPEPAKVEQGRALTDEEFTKASNAERVMFDVLPARIQNIIKNAARVQHWASTEADWRDAVVPGAPFYSSWVYRVHPDTPKANYIECPVVMLSNAYRCRTPYHHGSQISRLCSALAYEGCLGIVFEKAGVETLRTSFDLDFGIPKCMRFLKDIKPQEPQPKSMF